MGYVVIFTRQLIMNKILGEMAHFPKVNLPKSLSRHFGYFMFELTNS